MTNGEIGNNRILQNQRWLYTPTPSPRQIKWLRRVVLQRFIASFFSIYEKPNFVHDFPSHISCHLLTEIKTNIMRKICTRDDLPWYERAKTDKARAKRDQRENHPRIRMLPILREY